MGNQDTTFTRVTEVLAEQLGTPKEEIRMESKLADDLGADSLDTVEVVMAMEDEFSCEIPDEKTDALTTVADVVGVIDDILKEPE